MKTLCDWCGSANKQWLNMWNYEIISYLSSLIKPSKQQQLKNKINETPCDNRLASGDFKSTEESVCVFLLHQALFKWLSNQHAFSAASLCLVLWMKTKRAGWIARKERGLWLTSVAITVPVFRLAVVWAIQLVHWPSRSNSSVIINQSGRP